MANFGANFAAAASSPRAFASVPDATGGILVTAGRAYARYLGTWEGPSSLTAIDGIVYVSAALAVAGGGGASLNWAEVAIATGPLATQAASINLTMLAYASIDTEVRAAATLAYAKSLTGFSIAPGRDMWLVAAASYEVTQATFRSPSGEEVQGFMRIRAATRPSLNLNTPLAFTWTAGSALNGPWMRAQVP